MRLRTLKQALARRIGEWNADPPSNRPRSEYAIGYSAEDACLDKITIENCGLIRLEGWSAKATVDLPRCFVSGEEIPMIHRFRTYRPDVAAVRGLKDLFSGTEILYQLPGPLSGTKVVKITNREQVVFEAECAFQTSEPHYGGLLNCATVLHRNDIYTSGPPAIEVNHEVVALCQGLPSPVLDFGCGAGALIRALRAKNIEASGIELQRDEIVNSLLSEVRDHVHLYDGQFPLPFADEQFNTVTAVEVIEHLDNLEGALSEIARITRSHFLITAPDMSSVPLCHRENVVPWHLLEGTHVNFFNQTSLESTLRRYFKSVEVARIGPVRTNDTKWFVSLAAVCRK